MERTKKIVTSFFRIGVFVILCGFLFVTLEYSLKPSAVDLQNIAGFYGEEDKTLDMVYIGGSAAFVYWEPLRAYEKHGLASFSYAANTIQAEFYEMMVKEILKTQDPEVIVIDARAFQYRDIYRTRSETEMEVAYRNVLTGLPYSWNRFQFIEEHVPKVLNQDTLSYHFDLIKYHGQRDSVNIKENLKMMFRKYQQPYKGFFFVPKIDTIKKHDFETEAVTPVSEDTAKILTDLLAYLKTTKQKYLFVVSPYSEEKEHKEIYNYVEKVVTDSGYDFLDTNEHYKDMKMDFQNDFYNDAHVNIYGAEKYTDFLYQYLSEHYELPDHRGEERYADWDSLLDPWNQEVENVKAQIEVLRKERDQ